MVVVYKTKIDIKSPPSRFMPAFVQYDHARLEIELLDEGEPYDLSTARRVEFTHVRSDRLVIIEPGELIQRNNGYVLAYEYKGNEMDLLGKIKASIAIFDAANKKTSTHAFEVQVIEDLRDEVFNPAEPNIGVLPKLLERVEYAIANTGGGGGGGSSNGGTSIMLGSAPPQSLATGGMWYQIVNGTSVVENTGATIVLSSAIPSALAIGGLWYQIL